MLNTLDFFIYGFILKCSGEKFDSATNDCVMILIRLLVKT